VSGDVLPTVLGIVLVAAAAAFALLPFARGVPSEVTSAEGGATDRFTLYRQVIELEFDFQMGKLTGEDYTRLSGKILAEAGQALRDEKGDLGEVDEEIEREIAAARAAFAAARQSTQPKRAAGTPS
jgi:hypothetical protein